METLIAIKLLLVKLLIKLLLLALMGGTTRHKRLEKTLPPQGDGEANRESPHK